MIDATTQIINSYANAVLKKPNVKEMGTARFDLMTFDAGLRLGQLIKSLSLVWSGIE
jgi:hypothetical protein